MTTKQSSGVLHFRVQDEFITKHPRELLREDELGKAISFLKTIGKRQC